MSHYSSVQRVDIRVSSLLLFSWRRAWIEPSRQPSGPSAERPAILAGGSREKRLPLGRGEASAHRKCRQTSFPSSLPPGGIGRRTQRLYLRLRVFYRCTTRPSLTVSAPSVGGRRRHLSKSSSAPSSRKTPPGPMSNVPSRIFAANAFSPLSLSNGFPLLASHR